MLAAGTIALTSLAGQTVVKAAGTDTWEAAKRGIARLLGRGDQEQEQLAEHRLEQTCVQLAKAAAPYGELGISLAAQWATRLADLLEDDPDVEADLRVLVQRIQKEPPGGMVSADDYAVAAGRDVNLKADRRGVSGQAVYGSVML